VTRDDPRIEALKRGLDALNRRDASLVEDVFAPETEMFPLAATALQGTDVAPYRGYDGIRRYIRDFAEVWGEYEYAPEEFRIAGDTVVARVHVTGESRSGLPLEQELGIAVEFAGDRVHRLVAYPSWDEALAAAGG
jgi:ketosteroid isomerase-like protein